MLSHQTAIRCCYLVAFLDLFAVGMFYPLFNRRGRQLGASPTVLGLIGSMYGGLQLFSSPYMGKASDTWGRKPVLLLSYLGCFLGYLTMGVSDSILFLMLARLPTGILKHSQTAARAHLSDIALPDEKAGVMGRFNAIGTIGFIVGPIIGGAVAMHENGFFKVSLLTCTIYVVAFIFVWSVFDNKVLQKANESSADKLPGQHEIMDEPQGTIADDIKKRKHVPVDVALKNEKPEEGKAKEPAGISRLFYFLKIDSIRNVLDLFLIKFVMSLGMMIYHSNFIALLDYRYSLDAQTTGYFISFGSIASVISSMFIGPIYSIFKSDAKMFLFGGLLMTMSLFGISVSPNIYVILFCMVPRSFSSAIMRVNSHNLILKRCHADERGAVVGVGNSLISIGRMLSPVIAGLFQEISVVGPCWLATCLMGVGVGLMIVFPQDKPSVEETKKTD